MEIRHVYPVWKWSMLWWVAVAVFGLVMAGVSLASSGENAVEGVAVAVTSGSVLAAVALLAMTAQIMARRELVDRVVAVRNYPHLSGPEHLAPIAFVDGGVGSSLNTFVDQLLNFDGLLLDVERRFAKYLWKDVELPGDTWSPVTFVIFRPEGQVKRRLLSGAWQRCRGLSSGNTVEVEWSEDAMTRFTLVRHELAHVLLSHVYPKMGEAEQHIQMGQVGIR